MKLECSACIHVEHKIYLGKEKLKTFVVTKIFRYKRRVVQEIGSHEKKTLIF